MKRKELIESCRTIVSLVHDDTTVLKLIYLSDMLNEEPLVDALSLTFGFSKNEIIQEVLKQAKEWNDKHDD